MTQVIDVPGVRRSFRPLLRRRSVRKAVQAAVGAPVVACSASSWLALNTGFHPFVGAIDLAFRRHLPLTLSPDMLWLLVVQGLARSVQADPEAMRHHFVEHEGQVSLEVRREDFVDGVSEHDWPTVVAELSRQVSEHIGPEKHDDLVVSFSTTGPVERMANEIALLDAMQSYFTYSYHSWCGIPQVRLEGTPEDWVELAAAARGLGVRYDCTWWTEHLTPYLDRVALCATGVDDRDLWRSLYKFDNESGGPYATGWITQCFPFIQSPNDGGLRRNPFLGKITGGTNAYQGITHDTWPGALSRVPFQWTHMGVERPMQFAAGFTHFTQSARTLALRPAIAWAVAELP